MPQDNEPRAKAPAGNPTSLQLEAMERALRASGKKTGNRGFSLQALNLRGKLKGMRDQ